MTSFRVRYQTAPGIPHVYCRVFVAQNGGTYAATGNLTMRREEFDAFRQSFNAEFIAEGDGES